MKNIIVEWKDAEENEIEYIKFTSGITNFCISFFFWNFQFLFLHYFFFLTVYCAKYKSNKVLLRIYGQNTEHYIDRDKENLFMDSLGHLPYIAKIYGCFKNGVVYEFLPGKTLDSKEMINHYKPIATRLAELHQLKVR